jgi:hypothetical protein
VVAPPVEQPAVPVDPALLTRRQAELLIGRYVGAYEAGNLDAFLALFTPDVASNEGNDRETLAAHYRDFFRSTYARRLEVYQLRWDWPDRDQLRLRFMFRASIRRGAFEPEESFLGQMTFGIRAGADGWRISRFFYQVEKN